MGWTSETIWAVWSKAGIVQGQDSNKWRLDTCGAWIGWTFYGDRDSEYGWEIDHIIPKDRGGSDNLSNLRALQWQNNASKSDGRLVCAVTASGVHNAAIAH